jgi:acyl dehydratase
MSAFSIEETDKSSREKMWTSKEGGDESTQFYLQFYVGKKKRETVVCGDATASTFFAKVRDEVFAHFDEVAAKVTLVC